MTSDNHQPSLDRQHGQDRSWDAAGRAQLEQIGHVLDMSRLAITAVITHHTDLEQSLHRADHQIRDLQWDAARILLNPGASPVELSAVTTDATQLLTQLSASRRTAEGVHHLLESTHQRLQHAGPVIASLAETARGPEQAATAAQLATRLEHLSTLVEVTLPLAERTARRLENAHRALDEGMQHWGNHSSETVHQFWGVHHTLFDTNGDLAAAQATNVDAREVLQTAATAGTRTAAHLGDIYQRSSPAPSHPSLFPPRHSPPDRRGPSTGPSI